MSTTTAAHHHFPHGLALAAASVVAVGGLTVFGIATAQDDGAATQAPAQAPAKVIPHHGSGHNSRSVEESMKSGHAEVGLP